MPAVLAPAPSSVDTATRKGDLSRPDHAYEMDRQAEPGLAVHVIRDNLSARTPSSLSLRCRAATSRTSLMVTATVSSGCLSPTGTREYPAGRPSASDHEDH
jgi:hypothetical protein